MDLHSYSILESRKMCMSCVGEKEKVSDNV
jgi:hypothetical protein